MSDTGSTDMPEGADQQAGAGTPPPPPAAATAIPSPSPATPAGPARKRSVPKITALGAVVVVVIFFLGQLVFGGGGGSSAKEILIAGDLQGDTAEFYLASIKDNQLQTSSRLGSGLSGFTVIDSVGSTTSTWTRAVVEGKRILTVNDVRSGESDEQIVSIDAKTGVETSVYKADGTFGEVTYVRDKKTFLVNDENDCFAIGLDSAPTRLSTGWCSIAGGKIYALDQESDGTTLNLVELTGGSSGSNRFNLPITSEVNLQDGGKLVTGKSSEGRFEVYSTSDGRSVYRAEAGQTVTVLGAASEKSALLLSIEDEEKEDETLDVGVMSVTDGSGTFKKLTSVYQASGILSPDGSRALLFTNDKSDSPMSMTSWDVGAGKSTPVGSTFESIVSSYVDSADYVAVVTDKDFIVGRFGGAFTSRAVGKFQEATISESGSGIVAKLLNNSKYDLLYVAHDAPVDGDRKVVNLATGADGISIDDSSLTIEGQIVYGEVSDSYVEIYKQALKSGAQRKKIAEGKLKGFQLGSDGVLYYYESDNDRVTTYTLKGEDPNKRKLISDRYYAFTAGGAVSPLTLRNPKSVAQYSGTAFVDQDLRSCRSDGLPILASGDTQSFTLSRTSTDTTNLSDYEHFCVRTDGQTSVNVEVSTVNRRDGDTYGNRWVYLRCYDSESSYSSTGDSNAYYSTPSVYISSKGVYDCKVADGNMYYSNWNGYAYEAPTMGLSVTVTISASMDSSGD